VSGNCTCVICDFHSSNVSPGALARQTLRQYVHVMTVCIGGTT
jgi:hypothetical protein